MEEDRIISSGFQGEDVELEYSLRPRYLAEYIGQTKVKEMMSLYIQAAKSRKEPLDHVLLYGPPGLGKTTFAGVIANEMGVNCRITSGPAINHGGDLATILTNLEAGDVLFIDEIHRLNAAVEEVLYPAMEDFAIDIILGKGAGARSIRIDLPRFTLVGATTRAGMLTAPLRDRFGIISRLELYPVEELVEIITRSAQILGAQIQPEGAQEVARRARGTPRIANRLLRRVRDFAEVRGDGVISLDIANYALDNMGIDALGLDEVDRNVMRVMIEKFAGRPIGLDTIAAATGEDTATIEDIYEPYLLQIGFLTRTPRGRSLLPAAYTHMGYAVPAQMMQEGQLSLLDTGDANLAPASEEAQP